MVPTLRSRKVAEEFDDFGEIAWEKDGQAENPRLRRFWLVCGGLLTAVLLAGLLASFLRERDEESQPVAVAEPVPPGKKQVAASELGTETYAVMKVVSAFIAAESKEEKMKWVVRSEGIEDRMRNHYGKHPVEPKQVYDFPVIALTQRSAGNFYTVRALTVDEANLDFSVPLTNDGPRIAWEAHVGYSELEWDEFLGTRPASAVEMRAYIETAAYYISPYEQGGDYLSVEFSRPGSDRKQVGFVSKSATDGVERMAEILTAGQPVPVALRIRFPEEQPAVGEPVALVDTFLHRGWFGEATEPGVE